MTQQTFKSVRDTVILQNEDGSEKIRFTILKAPEKIYRYDTGEEKVWVRDNTLSEEEFGLNMGVYIYVPEEK